MFDNTRFYDMGYQNQLTPDPPLLSLKIVQYQRSLLVGFSKRVSAEECYKLFGNKVRI